MEKGKQKIIVVVGPTASGKSALAVKLARKFKGEIISADSRQVYKGLDIGTGKITKKEMFGVPHHLLDVADPKKQFSVSEYKKLAEEKIKEINFPIIVGGTGFYIDAITGRVNFPDVAPDRELREKFSKKSTLELFKILQKKDPRRAKTIDPYNKIRLIRALEIIQKIGSVPQLGSPTSKYNFVFIGLKPNSLDERIYKRLIPRIPGIIRETKKLSKKRAYELGLEYRFASLYLQGKLTKKELVEKLNIAIRQYAKRQMTWFKRNKNIKWFTLSAVEGFKLKELKEIEKYVRIVLNKGL